MEAVKEENAFCAVHFVLFVKMCFSLSLSKTWRIFVRVGAAATCVNLRIARDALCALAASRFDEIAENLSRQGGYAAESTYAFNHCRCIIPAT